MAVSSPMNELEKLAYATRLVSQKTLYFSQVHDWVSKHDTLLVQLYDLPRQVEAYKARKTSPSPKDPRVTTFERAPGIRLANACEATANVLYSVAEIAANFGNKASSGVVPSSFNKLCKKCQESPDMPVARALGDLQWYLKVRELRTEWAHYSSIFIGGGSKEEPLICVRSYRRDSDRVAFADPNFNFPVPDLIRWTRNALLTLDGFAGYLLMHHVLPKFNLDELFDHAVHDEDGDLVMLEGNLLKVEKLSIREYLVRGGIIGS
jgi:hypothetical protein